MTAGLARAREELAAAQLLSTNGFSAQAVARAFHAACYAAEAALLVLGETRAEHAQVVAVFVRRVVRERGLDAEAGRLLRSLFNRCRQAELSYEPVPPAEAPAAVRDATAVVAAVSAWLDAPAHAANGRVQRRARPVRRRR